MDKVAMYMEKIALNAQKAREMAKEVGVATEGNWKWALRNLRNMKTGDTLKSKELAKAKEGIGFLPNNAYHKIKSQSRKLPSNTEIAGTIDEKTKKIKDMVRGSNGSGNVSSANNNNFHTHPGYAGEGRFGNIINTRKEVSKLDNDIKDIKKSKWYEGVNDQTVIEHELMKKRVVKENEMRGMHSKKRSPLVADASGGITAFSSSKGNLGDLKAFGKDYDEMLFNDGAMENAKEQIEKYKKMNPNKATGNRFVQNQEDLIKHLQDRNNGFERKVTRRYNRAMDWGFGTGNYGEHSGLGNSDIDSFMKKTPDKNQYIVAPEQDFQAVHKVRPGYKRSVFFDRSPRRER